MTKHIYSIGQSVTLGAGARINSNPTVYTVTGLLPPLGVEFQYRIRGECEAHERVVVEHAIKALEPTKMSAAEQSQFTHASERARVFAKLS